MKSKNRIVVALSALLLCATADAFAQAPRIASFDAARGGEGALATASQAAGIRADISAALPGATYVQYNSLVTLSTASADVVVLNSVFTGSGGGITPLSSAEQAALTNFVRAGGAAILLGDNPSFTAASSSFLNPFGFTETGDAPGISTATLSTVAGGNPLAGGPAGTVSAFDVRFYRFLSGSLPTGAVPLATVGSSLVGAYLPEGAFAPGAGEVFAFSDSLYYDTPAGTNSNRAVVNAIRAAGTVAVVPEAGTGAFLGSGLTALVAGGLLVRRRTRKAD